MCLEKCLIPKHSFYSVVVTDMGSLSVSLYGSTLLNQSAFSGVTLDSSVESRSAPQYII